MKKIILATIVGIIILAFSGCVNIRTTPTSDAFNVSIISYPADVKGDTNFTIQWKVSGGEGNISHTAVHWGLRSGGADIKDYGRFSNVYTGKIPQQFSTDLISPTEGTIHFRAHAMVNGTDVYSPEYVIMIISNI